MASEHGSYDREIVASPVGPLLLVGTKTHLVCLHFSEHDDRLPTFLQVASLQERPILHGRVRAQLEEYFAGERETFDLPLDLRGSPFQRRVWNGLRRIPFGHTWSYGRLAREIGGAHARPVGAANGANPIAIIVPCHRVVGHDGSLVGFGGGLDRKRWLLEHEAQVKTPALPFAPEGLRFPKGP